MGCSGCVLSCDKNAIAYVMGDLLIDVSECAACSGYGGVGLPSCVQACPNSTDKVILEQVGVEEKRRRSAGLMPLFRV
jgi:ferredoxin